MLRSLYSAIALFAGLTQLRAGGSGLNVAVVVNQRSSDSLQLGNYYCEKRQVPPQNVLRIDWPGGNVTWSLSDFASNLLNPLTAMLASRRLTNQIDYVVLSMDIPYRVTSSASLANNGATSVLFYGFQSDPHGGCSIALGSTNQYAASESVFRSTTPSPGLASSFLAIMITSSNLTLAKQIVDLGIAGDGTFPTQPAYLDKGSDSFRNVRYVLFDNAVFEARVLGDYGVQRSNWGNPYGQTNLDGFQLGAGSFDILPHTFVPGAMADDLTSFGGYLLDPNGQPTLLAFLSAGACASYGTVDEPCNFLQKFPSPMNYFYQARGFSAAECYYQSLVCPYQGLLVGEPLAAPFAHPASGTWTGLPANATLVGATNLSLQFTAADSAHPLQQVDLFVDGVFQQTLTNVPPTPGNLLDVTLNHQSVKLLVSPGATLNSIAAALTAKLNAPGTANSTQVVPQAIGDRILLRSVDSSKAGSQVSLSVSSSAGNAPAVTTFIRSSGTNFLDTIASGTAAFAVSNAPALGDYLQLAVTRTNGTVVSVSVTNNVAGATVSALVQNLVTLVNSTPGLSTADGVAAKDFIPGDTQWGIPLAVFNLVPLTPGWNAARIQASLSGSPTFAIQTSASPRLDANRSDLVHRAHLYLTAGVTNLPLTFLLDTSSLSDGFHEFEAVAYEGSNVRTQTRIGQTVLIQNTALSATFTTPMVGTNISVDGTLAFSVAANSTNVAQIQLFSTGGMLGTVSGQSTANFSVPASTLDVGLHGFFAIVTYTNGSQYRTAIKWIRINPPFRVSIAAPPPTLAWPAIPGFSYDILSATNPSVDFGLVATLAPSNSVGQWTETNTVPSQLFYRVRASLLP